MPAKKAPRSRGASGRVTPKGVRPDVPSVHPVPDRPELRSPRGAPRDTHGASRLPSGRPLVLRPGTSHR